MTPTAAGARTPAASKARAGSVVWGVLRRSAGAMLTWTVNGRALPLTHAPLAHTSAPATVRHASAERHALKTPETQACVDARATRPAPALMTYVARRRRGAGICKRARIVVGHAATLVRLGTRVREVCARCSDALHCDAAGTCESGFCNRDLPCDEGQRCQLGGSCG